MYYIENAGSRFFGPFDYIRQQGLSDDDLSLVGAALGIGRIDLVGALTGAFPLFDNWQGKIRGAVLTHASSLQGLEWRRDLTTEIVPLQRVAIPTPPPPAVMVFLPSHTNASRHTPQAEQAMVHEQNLVLRALSRRFKTVVLSIHPSDTLRRSHIHEHYRTIEGVQFAEEALEPTPDFDGPGLHELSCIVFAAYLTNGSSADIYVRRLHGEGRTIDHRVLSWVLQDVEMEFQSRLETMQAEKEVLMACLDEWQRAISMKDAAIAELTASRSWRLTAPLRRIGQWARQARQVFR